MRNIEEIAAEEEAKAREILSSRLNFLLRWGGLALGIWGWVLFAHGNMDEGAFLVTASFFLWAVSWDILRVVRGNSVPFFTGILSLSFAFGLYFQNRLPSFDWGGDPAFWLSVHAGAVDDPPWSPLSYLIGQSACFLLPDLRFSILPTLSAALLSVALFFMAQEYFSQLKSQTLQGLLWVLLLCGALAASAPFSSAGTLGSGLVAVLGFLLLLFQRVLLGLEEKPWRAIYFLLGMLWSVNPLWGILGLLAPLRALDLEGRSLNLILPPLLAGLSPYLWIFFRQNRFFPSWGGNHPFSKMLEAGGWFIPQALSGRGSLPEIFRAMGWSIALLAVFSAFLWFLYFFKWKAGGKTEFTALDFWLWVLAGLGGVFEYSPTSWTLGPTVLWFVAGLGGGFLRLLEKGAERRQGVFFSGKPLAWLGSLGLLLALGLAWVPGQGALRGQPYFPQQHALNLLKTLHPKAILICQDPFDAAACREARLMDPMALDTVILDQGYLNQRWYVSQVMEQAPEILFSSVAGPPVEVLKRIVVDNRDLWDIHWDLSALPPDWNGPPAAPTVLTQEFAGPATRDLDPEKAQYLFDLTAVPEAGNVSGSRSFAYFTRYVTGFNELGKYLLGQERYSEAIHAFERSVKLAPDFQEPQNYLAQMYSKQNILEAARLEFEKTVKTTPQKLDQLMKELEYAQKTQDDAGTVALLDQMIHLNSELADAEYQLSKIYGQEGRSEEAKALLESSVKLNPQQLEAQMTLGRLMAHLGNRIRAEEAFRAVLEIDPQNKQAQVEIWKLLNKP